MPQYKVIAGACPYMVKNIVLDAGQIVEADFFLDDDADRLVKGGFIEAVVSFEVETPKKEKGKKGE